MPPLINLIRANFAIRSFRLLLSGFHKGEPECCSVTRGKGAGGVSQKGLQRFRSRMKIWFFLASGMTYVISILGMI
jgi:hypothetical protein